MVGEAATFRNVGLSWAERAAAGGLEAVVSLGEAGRPALFLHGIHSYGAAQAAAHFASGQYILDFGCGNGRFSRYLASKGYRVLGTEITWEMVLDAKSHTSGQGCGFVITDGISIPVKSNAVAGIWCCAVLRYSLLVTNPCYSEIAKEMFRVLEPGACVFNVETYVDNPPERFTAGFEEAGFRTRRIIVVNRYNRFLLRWFARNRYIPRSWLQPAGELYARWRAAFADSHRAVDGLRDYMFVWQKPEVG